MYTHHAGRVYTCRSHAHAHARTHGVHVHMHSHVHTCTQYMLCEKALAQLAQSVLLPFWRLKESPKKPRRLQASTPLSEEHKLPP